MHTLLLITASAVAAGIWLTSPMDIHTGQTTGEDVVRFTPKQTHLENELFCLVQNIYHEARGEDPYNQVAVAYVTLNRVKSERYPNTICEVVWQPHQFSWTSDGRSDKMLDFDAIEAAVDIGIMVMRGEIADPTDGMMHYYAHKKISAPRWASEPVRVAVLGNHTFVEVN